MSWILFGIFQTIFTSRYSALLEDSKVAGMIFWATLIFYRGLIIRRRDTQINPQCNQTLKSIWELFGIFLTIFTSRCRALKLVDLML